MFNFFVCAFHQQEKEENERLRVKIRSLEVQGEHQDKELVSTRSRLEMEAAKKPSMATLDSQGWKSAVQTRMYEEKIRSMEADLEKKVKKSGHEWDYLMKEKTA